MAGIEPLFVYLRLDLLDEAAAFLLHILFAEQPALQRRFKQHGKQQGGAFFHHRFSLEGETVIDAARVYDQRAQIAETGDGGVHPRAVQLV